MSGHVHVQIPIGEAAPLRVKGMPGEEGNLDGCHGSWPKSSCMEKLLWVVF